MKIYYFTQVTSQIEELIELDITPKKYGSIGEHLAYAISDAEKFTKKIRLNNLSKEQLNKAVRKVFVNRMHESPLTRNLINEMLSDEFDFTVRDLSTALAKLFVLDNPASPIVTDHRVELHIPECPIYLTPIKYGIKFNNDPNWYDIDAAYQTIFVMHANRNPISPSTTHVWTGIQDYNKFTIDKTATEAASDSHAARQFFAIAGRLRMIYSLIPQDSYRLRPALQQPFNPYNDNAFPLYFDAPAPFYFDVPPPQQENFSFSGMATMLRYLQQNLLNLEMVPNLVALGTAGSNSLMQIPSILQMIRIMEGEGRIDAFATAAFIAIAVVPDFLMRYKLNSVATRYSMRMMGLLAQQAPRQQDEDVFQIPVGNQNNQRQQNRWSISGMIQRFGFMAPEIDARIARVSEFLLNPERGLEIAGRLGFRL
jgi:hypothetical protein